MNLLENRVGRPRRRVRACIYVYIGSVRIALTYWRPQVWSKLLAGLASILRRLFYTSNIPPPPSPRRRRVRARARRALLRADIDRN